MGSQFLKVSTTPIAAKIDDFMAHEAHSCISHTTLIMAQQIIELTASFHPKRGIMPIT